MSVEAPINGLFAVDGTKNRTMYSGMGTAIDHAEANSAGRFGVFESGAQLCRDSTPYLRKAS
jgi:hypothetical protein